MTDIAMLAPSRRGYLELALRRLRTGAALDGAEEDAVRALQSQRCRAAKGETLPGPSAGSLHLLLEGWAGKARALAGGRRQMFEIMIPGDALGNRPAEGARDPYTYIALTNAAYVDATPLVQDRHPGIAAALASERRRAHVRLLDQVVRLGAYNAYERVGHLLIELYTRQAEIGMADGGRFAFPIGQERLGEILGLSAVHVNRTLTALKRDGRLAAGPGWFALPRLRDLAAEIGVAPSPAWAG